MVTDDLANKVIPIWIITFDQDLDRTYVYARKDKVIASISSAVRVMLPPEPEAEEIILEIAEDLVNKLNEPYVPIIINDNLIAIRRIELDKHNPIVSIMVACHDNISLRDETDLKRDIESLFVNPA